MGFSSIYPSHCLLLTQAFPTQRQFYLPCGSRFIDFANSVSLSNNIANNKLQEHWKQAAVIPTPEFILKIHAEAKLAFFFHLCYLFKSFLCNYCISTCNLT